MVNKTLFQCPNCAKPLKRGHKQYFCSNGHCFDIAKQGYVNLLLPGHTGTGKPGDTKEMIRSRREFLDKGYYQEFSDTLNNMVLETLKTEQSDSISIFDAGCGEGYYISRLKQKFFDNNINNLDMYGIDVSKSAIQYAGGRDKDIHFAVASSYHVPILANSIDCILCIFAPRDEKEFKRILKPSGKLIVAAPGPKHLYSLRKFLYDSPDVIGQKGTVEEGFNLLLHKLVSYSITINDKEDIFNLFNMTPYSRHTDDDAENKLKTIGEFTTEVDINIRVYQKA
ncbi:putative RNA methyltransferase [Ruminiclostridium josui]|uniref:putative RNA methyltransferase n=1 Tax=Ruminiclostridium josui TaxID=1499 RepID=UPI000465D1F9|nr:methyltransferase domain-containing protein [Ruminiclostridium josui]